MSAESVQTTSAASPRPRAVPAILVGGIITGVLDLLYAMVVYSPHRPLLIPLHIATGVLGVNAYKGGVPTIILGVVLHFVIAIGAATVYYLASRRLPILVERPILCGMIFGGLVYFFMHLVVVPLSAVPHHATRFIYQATEFVEHWFVVGLPIAFSVRRYSR
jgi:uncharacterized membrane protein YagU involved in acid resistance